MTPSAALADFYDYSPETESFRDAVLRGLAKPRKALPCKFFYDERGSALFDEICTLDEYYPTRTETALLENHAAEIAALMGPSCLIIEFGSGSSAKIRTLLDRLEAPTGYVPVDISREHLLRSAGELALDHPHIDVVAVCADYTQPFTVPQPGGGGEKRVGFFPGSTIGNFTPDEARAFLASAAAILGRGGEMLIGVDLKKDERILHAAYNDSRGVTADFNLNLLRRINRELDGDFDIKAFRHRATYNRRRGRIEMHLVSDTRQTVRIDGVSVDFAAGETIHTESSHKFTVGEFKAVAGGAGFDHLRTWTDDDDLFSVHYLRVS